MALVPGTRFGTYEVVEPIGSGGMGEVYRATDTSLKRDIALKVLPPDFVNDSDRLARFQREAEVLASLNDTNIAQVFGLEKADGQMAIIMELVEGSTLADRIGEGPIPPDEAMGIALQVLAALEAAHTKGIVHRDLKPANVKVTDDGIVKVLDFGISKPIDPSVVSGGTPVATTPAMTQTGVILGTAAYMSPEQARGKFVDQRTDIWAFGCLLFEMLTGQPAFGGEDVMAILARVIDRDTDLSPVPTAISPAVRETIRLCLQKDAKRRIADVRDVRLALAGEFESRRQQTAEIAHPFWRRAFPIISAVLVAVVLTWAVSSSLRPESDPPLLTQFAIELPHDIALNGLTASIVAVSPRGNLIAYGADGTLAHRADKR
jgi:serine/threonine protein kinase